MNRIVLRCWTGGGAHKTGYERELKIANKTLHIFSFFFLKGLSHEIDFENVDEK
jgi:hypothetical protein